MARRPGHEQVDDALGLGGKMGLLRRQRIAVRGRSRLLGAALLLQQAGQGDAAKADGAITEEPAAGNLRWVLAAQQTSLTIHSTVPHLCPPAVVTCFPA